MEMNRRNLLKSGLVAAGSPLLRSLLPVFSDMKRLRSNKILIVYLSRTNNTKAIAEIIQRSVGGRLVALELEKPYPENYQQTVQQVVKENETGYLPPLKTKI